jgi:hypothetical protein
MLTLGGCGSSEEPHLCVFAAGSFDPDSVEGTTCEAKREVIAADSTFFVVHVLPEDTTVDEPVTITVSTACSSQTKKYVHAQGRVVVPLIAPKGSSCALTVTADLLNTSQKHTSLIDPALCTAEAAACEGGAGGAASSP